MKKKRIKYRSFEYITFYEGARIALERLEAEGYAVSLYVYDVAEDDVNQIKKLIVSTRNENDGFNYSISFSKNHFQ